MFGRRTLSRALPAVMAVLALALSWVVTPPAAALPEPESASTWDTVSLTGTEAAEAAPVFAVEPTSVEFPLQSIWVSSDPVTVTVTNDGTTPLHTASVRTAESDASQFAITTDSCTGSSVAPGESCTVAVSFRPTWSGSLTAVLRFVDDAAGSPHDVALTGTVYVPSFSVVPNPVEFGAVPLGPSRQTVTVHNAASQPLVIQGTGLRGADPDQFQIWGHEDRCMGAVLDRGESCMLQVRFQPTSAGRKTALLALGMPAMGRPEEVPLAGTAVPAPMISGIEPVAGPVAGGNAVTIRGRHLADVTWVHFGDVDARVTANTDTQVRVVAPRHAAGNVDVRLHTVGGVDAVADGYRYVAAPVPPGPPSAATYTPGRWSTVRWAGVANATGYQVRVNGRLSCSRAAATSFCKVPGKLGPKAEVEVRSLGAGGTHSAWASARYRANPTPVLLATAHFPPFSARLTAATKNRLRRVARLLAAQGFRSVVLTGYTARTPGKGSPTFRLRLSKQRAAAVKRFLQRWLDQLDAEVRIQIRAKGGRNPIADNGTKKGRAQNRRVQVALS